MTTPRDITVSTATRKWPEFWERNDERDVALAEGKRWRGERSGRTHDGVLEVRERDSTSCGGVDKCHSPRVAAGARKETTLRSRSARSRTGTRLLTEGGCAKKGAVARRWSGRAPPGNGVELGRGRSAGARRGVRFVFHETVSS
jgi:hypothetical protein